MDSLKDYVLWMRDIPISVTGFKEADALILSNLVYINMTPVFEENKSEGYHLRDCQKIIDSGKVVAEIAIKDDKYTELLQAAVDSRRFGELKISDYIDIKHIDPPAQFAAVCFHDDANLSFMAFRGTDDSLAGWYEDFITCYSVTEAQTMAKEYAERVIGNAPGRRWMMGGHSKGGNLALYAGTTMNKTLFSAVERIYDLDGQGLCMEVMGWPSVDSVMEKTTRILPEFSVVGRIFDMSIADTKIIRSFEKGLLQHAPISWGIDHGNIAVAAKHSSFSIWFNDFFANWIACAAIEERKIFFNEVFEAVSAGGATTIEELAAQGIEGFKGIQLRLKNASDVTKRVMYEFTKQAFFSSLFPGQKLLK